MDDQADDEMMPSDHHEVRLFLPPDMAAVFSLAAKAHNLPLTRVILATLEAYGTKGAVFRQAERANWERIAKRDASH